MILVDENNIKNMNILVFAYYGDTVYENFVRRKLICDGIGNVNDLQKKAISYVSATRQAFYLKKLLDMNFFSDEEISIIKRARNYKGKSHSKSCDIITYKHATALEAIIGFLELTNNHVRVCEIMSQILEGKLC